MRWQTTAALAIVLIAIGAFYYVYEIRQGPAREQQEARKGRVFTAEPADVSEIQMWRPSDTVELKREGTGWQMLAPVKTSGDRATVDDTVSTVMTAKIARWLRRKMLNGLKAIASPRLAAATPAARAGRGVDTRLGAVLVVMGASRPRPTDCSDSVGPRAER